MGDKILYRLSRLWCVIIVALAVVPGLFLLNLGNDTTRISATQDRWLDTIHWLAWIGLDGGVAVIGIATFYFWVGQSVTLLIRVHTLLLLFASGILLRFGQTYNFIHISLPILYTHRSN